MSISVLWFSILSCDFTFWKKNFQKLLQPYDGEVFQQVFEYTLLDNYLNWSIIYWNFEDQLTIPNMVSGCKIIQSMIDKSQFYLYRSSSV